MKVTFNAKRCIILTLCCLGVIGCSSLFSTNQPVQPTATNGAPNANSNLVYTVSPLVSNITAGAQTVAGVLPPPWGTILGGVVTLAMAGLGVVAKVKTTAAQNNENMLTAVINGVETANNPGVKQAIQIASQKAGVAPQLAAKVATVTQPS